MKLKNKKGQIGELISDTAALIVIAFLLLIFFIISSSLWGFPKPNIEKQAIEDSLYNQEHVSLNNWLTRKVEVNVGSTIQEMTIAELIRLSELDHSYKGQLEKMEDMAFDKIYDTYKVRIMLSKDAFEPGYEIIPIGVVGGIFTIMPTVRIIESPLFYVPSNETIAVNMEIQK